MPVRTSFHAFVSGCNTHRIVARHGANGATARRRLGAWGSLGPAYRRGHPHAFPHSNVGSHAFGICTRTAILCTLIVFGREIESMASGTVKWFNPTKGYGFIQPQGGGGGRDVFVHISAVERAGLSSLNEGQAVEYEIESNRGKESATNLKVK